MARGHHMEHASNNNHNIEFKIIIKLWILVLILSHTPHPLLPDNSEWYFLPIAFPLFAVTLIIFLPLVLPVSGACCLVPGALVSGVQCLVPDARCHIMPSVLCPQSLVPSTPSGWCLVPSAWCPVCGARCPSLWCPVPQSLVPSTPSSWCLVPSAWCPVPQCLVPSVWCPSV